MFRCDHHHQGAYCGELAKITLLKRLVPQTYTNKDLITYAATPPD